MLSASELTHGDLLRGHKQYVGRTLKVNGSVRQDNYTVIHPNQLELMRPTSQRGCFSYGMFVWFNAELSPWRNLGIYEFHRTQWRMSIEISE
ncbi:hypothetical protein DA391_09810 [Yersinia massiliensis]|uniref:Uncharacterized protein n=1 Tax=Yersinia massiliensis TaxID=419257 RepID=A0ABM6URW6_9GAMM|nr:hypothetical protein DA391_09810 [Yersinia massiliensis]